jgi:hypothetical protein
VPPVLAPSEQLVGQIEKMGTIETMEAFRALYLMARSLGRAFAWPALSCSALETLHKDILQRKDLERNRDRYWLMNHKFVLPWTGHDESKCIWSDTLWSSCLEKGHGLLPQEFAHLLTTQHSEGKIDGLEAKMTLANFESKVKPVSELQVLYVDLVVSLEGLFDAVKKELAAANERGKCWALTMF